jgi:hypothetical protein
VSRGESIFWFIVVAGLYGYAIYLKLTERKP